MPVEEIGKIPKHRWTHTGDRVWLVKCVQKGGLGHKGFAWPWSGPVACPKALADRTAAATVTGDENTDADSAADDPGPIGPYCPHHPRVNRSGHRAVGIENGETAVTRQLHAARPDDDADPDLRRHGCWPRTLGGRHSNAGGFRRSAGHQQTAQPGDPTQHLQPGSFSPAHCSATIVAELELDPEILGPEKGDDGLQLIPRRGGDPHLVTLDRSSTLSKP